MPMHVHGIFWFRISWKSYTFLIQLISVLFVSSLYKASKIMCQRKLHHLLVLDACPNNNPLFLMSEKMILNYLKKYVSLKKTEDLTLCNMLTFKTDNYTFYSYLWHFLREYCFIGRIIYVNITDSVIQKSSACSK